MVAAGLQDLRNFTGAQTAKTDRRIVHERYNISSGSDNDIGLIHLKTNLTIDRNVQPICLPGFTPAENEPSVAIGWGIRNGKDS